MQVKFSTDDLIAITNPRSLLGSTRAAVHGLASLSAAGPGDLSFLGNTKYKAEVASTRASVVLLPSDYKGEPASEQLFLFVENPSVALARVCARIELLIWPKPTPGIHASSSIAP